MLSPTMWRPKTCGPGSILLTVSGLTLQCTAPQSSVQWEIEEVEDMDADKGVVEKGEVERFVVVADKNLIKKKKFF